MIKKEKIWNALARFHGLLCRQIMKDKCGMFKNTEIDQLSTWLSIDTKNFFIYIWSKLRFFDSLTSEIFIFFLEWREYI